MERGKEERAESPHRAVSIGSAQCWQRMGRTGLGFAQGWCEVSSHPLGSPCSPPRAWRRHCPPPPPPLPVSLEPPGAGKQTEWGQNFTWWQIELCFARPAQQHPVHLDGAQPKFTLCSKEPQRGHGCSSSVIIRRTVCSAAPGAAFPMSSALHYLLLIKVDPGEGMLALPGLFCSSLGCSAPVLCAVLDVAGNESRFHPLREVGAGCRPSHFPLH